MILPRRQLFTFIVLFSAFERPIRSLMHEIGPHFPVGDDLAT